MTTLLAESTTSRRTLHLRREAPAPHAPIVVMAPDEHAAPAAAGGAHPLDSATLLCGEKTVQITHNGFIYKLQATKFGKLILTK